MILRSATMLTKQFYIGPKHLTARCRTELQLGHQQDILNSPWNGVENFFVSVLELVTSSARAGFVARAALTNDYCTEVHFRI